MTEVFRLHGTWLACREWFMIVVMSGLIVLKLDFTRTVGIGSRTQVDANLFS